MTTTTAAARIETARAQAAQAVATLARAQEAARQPAPMPARAPIRDDLPARAALDLMQPAEVLETLAACYNHARRRADVYNLRADIFEAVSAEEITGAAYIAAAEILNRMDTIPADDPRRDWPLIRVFVRAVCVALRRTYRAEHGKPSAIVYLDALEDDAQRAALIDTAARAVGLAPETPEEAATRADTIENALRASCANDRDRAIITATADGETAAEIAARLGTTRAGIENALRRIRARAAISRARLDDWEKPIAAAFLADLPAPTAQEAEAVAAWIDDAARAARRRHA